MDNSKSGYACPRCTVGRCLPQKTTFTDVYHGQLLSIPNLRGFVCDVCHFVEFDQETMEALWDELYSEAAADESQPVAPKQRSSGQGEGLS